MRDQELNTTTAYYEGAARVTGTQNGKPISGVAYVELTGYNVQTREGYSR
jgi:predicted secreted hydrolase